MVKEQVKRKTMKNNSKFTHKQGGFNISEIAIKRPVSTVMLMMTFIILGIISYMQLSVEYYPNMTYPTITVSTNYPGASSGEMEALVSKPIEDAVSGISGISHVRSFSSTGLSRVTIEFNLEKDIKDAANEVREKVSLIRRKLPDEITEPAIARLDPDASPIINLAITSNEPLVNMTDYVRNVVLPRIEQVDGVSQIDLLGGQEREVQVVLNPEVIKKFEISPTQIANRLVKENLNFPSGAIQSGTTEISLRTSNAFLKAEQIANLPIKTKSGQRVRLKDLGKVIDGVQELRSRSLLNGKPAVVLSIQKQSGSNEVAISEQIDQKIKNLEKVMPPGMQIIKSFDTTKFILESKEAAIEELIVGSILAIVVIFFFLRTIRGTIISGIAIPTSVIATFACMYAFGFSLNTMTLLALALVVGILVDDAVVDLENIVRYIQAGENPFKAAIKATNEIGLAVVATTFSIVAVFIPIGFMKGTTGQLFKEFGLTVSCSVIVSLIVARTLTPMLCAYFMKSAKHHEEDENSFFGKLSSLYKEILEWSLKHRITVIVVTLIVFVVSIPVGLLLPKGFIPKTDRDEFNIAVRMPPGSTIKQTSEVLDTIYKRIKDKKYIKYLLVTAGNNSGKTDNGTIGVLLKSKKEGRKITVFNIQKEVRKLVRNIPGAIISFREIKVVNDNNSNYDVNLSIRGDDIQGLQKIASNVIQKLQKMPLISDTNTSSGIPEKEVDIFVDHDMAAELGVSASDIAATLRYATFGDTPSQIHLPSDDIDIRIRLDNKNRYNMKKLQNLGIPSENGGLVPLNSIARISYTTGPSIITRYDRQRQVVVLANAVPGTSMSDILTPIQQELDNMKLPPDVNYSFKGDAERANDAFNALVPALITAIIFIYLILASQFEHFIHPFTIMTALPLSFMGAFLSLFLTNQELGMMSAIGIVMLMGLVTKNSILLVDYTLTLIKEGHERDEALLIAGPVRLRPILMTTVAMIAGMTPVALQLTPGSEQRAPMAIAVIGGITTSTLLTLVVIPVFYTLMDDLVNKFYKPHHYDFGDNDDIVLDQPEHKIDPEPEFSTK